MKRQEINIVGNLLDMASIYQIGCTSFEEHGKICSCMSLYRCIRYYVPSVHFLSSSVVFCSTLHTLFLLLLLLLFVINYDVDDVVNWSALNFFFIFLSALISFFHMYSHFNRHSSYLYFICVISTTIV